MMLFSPPLMYYLWACLVFYDGQLVGPKSLSPSDIQSFLYAFCDLARQVRQTFQAFGSEALTDEIFQHASPTQRGAVIYLGLIAYQLFLAAIMPGFQQEGLPVPSLKGKRLFYNCNALACWYSTLVTAAGLHFGGIFHLGELIDRFGETMTWSIICGYTLGKDTFFFKLS